MEAVEAWWRAWTYQDTIQGTEVYVISIASPVLIHMSTTIIPLAIKRAKNTRKARKSTKTTRPIGMLCLDKRVGNRSMWLQIKERQSLLTIDISRVLAKDPKTELHHPNPRTGIKARPCNIGSPQMARDRIVKKTPNDADPMAAIRRP